MTNILASIILFACAGYYAKTWFDDMNDPWRESDVMLWIMVITFVTCGILALVVPFPNGAQ